MTVDNHVEMTQVRMPVQVVLPLGGRSAAASVRPGVHQLNVERQRLNATAQTRKHVIPQHPQLAFQLYIHHKAVVTTTIQLRFNCDSTAVRLPFDCNSTALRLFDDLRYDREPTCTRAAALRPAGFVNVTLMTFDKQ